jgi:hypothetical protein
MEKKSLLLPPELSRFKDGIITESSVTLLVTFIQA